MGFGRRPRFWLTFFQSYMLPLFFSGLLSYLVGMKRKTSGCFMCKRDNSHFLCYLKNLSVMPLGVFLVSLVKMMCQKAILLLYQFLYWKKSNNFSYNSLTLSSLQTNTDTLAKSADPEKMAHIKLSHQVNSNPCFATTDVSKFRDERVHFRN